MTENKATQERTPQERLQEEQEHKEHVHHTKINAAAIADHLLGNMHTLHVKLHQYHWYVKGANFFTLHEKFEELYNENEKWFDKLAERLITSGHKPASTTVEFEKYSLLLLYKSLTTKKLMHIKKMEKGLERIPIPKSASTFTLIFILIKSVIIF